MLKFFAVFLLFISNSFSLANASQTSKALVEPVFANINQSMVHYSKGDGLSQVTVLAIAQDQLGFMWFGTQGGLNRYDGYEFKQYKAKPSQKDQLAGNYITALCDDGNHNLWIGTSTGLSVYNYNSGVFTSFLSQFNNVIPDDNVISLTCDTNKVWVGTEGFGLYSLAFEDYLITPYPESAGMRILDIKSVNASVYFATEKGVFKQSTEKSTLVQLTNKSTKSIEVVNQILFAGRHDGWVDSYQITNEKFIKKFHISLSPILNNTVNDITHDKDRIWLATNNGAFAINHEGKVLESHVHQDINLKSLTDNIVLSVLVDAKSNYWFGTDAGGINYLSHAVKLLGHINQYSYPDSPLSEDDVRGFSLDGQGRVWVATSDGAFIFENEKFHKAEYYYPALKLLENAFISNVLFVQGDVWFTTLNIGVIRFNFDSNQVTLFSPKNSNAPSLRYNMSAVYQGEVLFGSRGHGLVKYDQSTTSLQPFLNEFDNMPEHLTDLLVQGDDLWFGSIGRGVFRYHKEKLEQLTVNEGVLSNLSFTLTSDGQQRVWVASGAGISIIDQNFKVERTLSQEDGLSSNAIWTMVFDKIGSMWVGSSNGLSRVNTLNFSVRNFNERDGIQSSEYNFGAGWLSPKGKVFIGGINGFNQFYSQNVVEESIAPKLYLVGVSILGQKIDQIKVSDKATLQPEYIKKINLGPKEDIVSFKFSSLDYSHQQLNYFYRVKGLSEQWLPMDNESREVNLIKLLPGSYQLESYVQNAQGVKSVVFTLPITLEAPWWWNTISKTLYILTILAILLLVWIIRQRIYNKVLLANSTMSKLQQRLQHSLWASGDELWEWNIVNNQVYRHSVVPRIDYGQEDNLINHHNIGNFIHPDEQTEYSYLLEQCIYHGSNSFEIPVRVKDLTNIWCWVLDKGKVIERNEQGIATRIAGAFKDINRLKEHEYSLEEMNEKLELKVAERTQELSTKNEKVEQALLQLQYAQKSLIENEKMAALGGLVAGVAHEINTPLGISITAISHNQDSLFDVEKMLKDKTLRQVDLQKAIEAQSKGYQMVLKNLDRANVLISNFKQVAVDQS
ncbi:ligand-binding sensor domain-containing protein [Colwellia hornerae]|uniref:histidine kinase n=1 Tax=Colwellia hornerae TaxID=89402 RepID=A0A5C6Q5W3_9GAMM|nr:two-component regulator propeller domain-containing protein [Colwellia hornerae]TWX59510.1 PAS domain-containing sensor histidine kinase [Colwellia hornerae]TWX62880.1 PAS domain-containing sensor histidine kinase [Colwellia hornerae]TWX64202.1 PAS domain-containing sensor histidine kinase [Colwellia hornerae]